MTPRVAIVGLVVVAGLTSATASGAPQRDPALAAALKVWYANKCVTPPNEVMWDHGWRFNSLFGNCRAGDGTDGHVYFFDRGRLIGTDGLGTSSEVLALWRDDRTFAFMYVIYRPRDSNCCPTGGGKVVRFRWDGRRFHALDRAPPRRTPRIAGR
jgi:hypothetical protein